MLTTLVSLAAFSPTGFGVQRPELSASTPVMAASASRRAIVGTGLLVASGMLPDAAVAGRPEGVNKPELLPSYQTNVIDLQRFLTSGQVKAIDKQLTELEKTTGIKVLPARAPTLM